MERKKRVVSVIFFVVMGLLPFVLTGCAAQEASGEAVRRLNDDPIDCAGATELTVFQEEGDWNELCGKAFLKRKKDVTEAPSMGWMSADAMKKADSIR